MNPLEWARQGPGPWAQQMNGPNSWAQGFLGSRVHFVLWVGYQSNIQLSVLFFIGWLSVKHSVIGFVFYRFVISQTFSYRFCFSTDWAQGLRGGHGVLVLQIGLKGYVGAMGWFWVFSESFQWICNHFGSESWRKMLPRGQLSHPSNQINSNSIKLISFTRNRRKKKSGK